MHLALAALCTCLAAGVPGCNCTIGIASLLPSQMRQISDLCHDRLMQAGRRVRRVNSRARGRPPKPVGGLPGGMCLLFCQPLCDLRD